MGRLVGWHVRLGETALRLFVLHLLWVAGTLAGGVVLGVFPATAAVVAVLRRDLVDGDDGPERPRLPVEFARVWRAEFAASNRLGVVLVAVWAFLLWDRHLLTLTAGSGLAAAAGGFLWFLTFVAAVSTALLWSLQAHFVEGVPALLRRALVLSLARPGVALGHAASVGVVLCVYYQVPGLVPVLGLPLPLFVSFAWLWRSGILPAVGRTLPVPAGAAA